MSNQIEPKLPKWPFFLLGDAVLLGLVWLIYAQSTAPMGRWEAALLLSCGALGSMLAITPFILEYRTAVKMIETGAFISTASQIQNLELLARQIGNATAQWQGVQELSTGSVTAAREIAERMTAETAAFSEFMQKANHAEKANLRLEVEKLRRAEGEWLQIVIRMLDHTYALHKAAVRSGQPALIEQLSNFQNACRDVARRAGLLPFIPGTNEAFDPELHQSTDSQAASMANPQILDTIATGFTYQGKLIRAALVSLQNPPPVSALPQTTAALTTQKNEGSHGRKALQAETLT
jgi:molecular chaperone GrpE (heat shock protein)